MDKIAVKLTALALAAIMTAALLSGCVGIREQGGVGRGDVTSEQTTAAAPTPTGNDTATEPATDAPTESETGSGSGPDQSEQAPIPVAPTGKVVRPADLSFLDSISRDFFSDAAADGSGTWYMGKTEYDASTGEVTTVYERSADTLELLDKYGAN